MARWCGGGAAGRLRLEPERVKVEVTRLVVGPDRPPLAAHRGLEGEDREDLRHLGGGTREGVRAKPRVLTREEGGVTPLTLAPGSATLEAEITVVLGRGRGM